MAITPTLDLSLSPGSDAVTPGSPVSVRVSTNLFETPISLTQSGSTSIADLAVCDGAATFTAGVLTVERDDAAAVTLTLCGVAAGVGTVSLSASAHPTTPDRLQWSQGNDWCQVFARFVPDSAPALAASATINVATVEPSPTPTPTVTPSPTVTPTPTPTPLPTPTTPGPGAAPGQPSLTTKASDRAVEPGAELFDTITIKGFTSGSDATGRATLYGPVGELSGRMCTPGNKVETVRFKPRNGTFRTPKVRVTRPGHYTWMAETTADALNKAAGHRCAMSAESTVVRKPSYRPPVISTGYDGTRFERPSRPGRLSFGAVHATAPVVSSSLRGGRMLVPADARRVGWLDRSAAVDDLIGTTVVAGHVSDARDRRGALGGLGGARPGQLIVYRTPDGVAHRFKVESRKTYPRTKRLPASLFRTTGAHRLVLVSCTDRVTLPGGGWHYRRNIVVVAKPVK